MSAKRLNFCTLFDSNYLSRGYIMAESLLDSDPNFFLYVIAFDDLCESVLRDWGHPRLKVIRLRDFEDERLLSIKFSRTAAEYCWTCTPFSIEYCLREYGLDHCTYLDADLFFFSSPRPLIEEMGERSVLITEHRYTPDYDQSELSGVYCVQFITFKADQFGLHVLTWWRDACLEWCYARPEEGRFGDQKYLDDWPVRFEGVHVLQHLGGGVAPWNVQQYEVEHSEGNLLLRSGSELSPLIFYHFHHITFLKSGRLHYGHYRLNDGHKKMIYQPYCDNLMSKRLLLSKRYPELPTGWDVDDSLFLFKRFFCKSLRKRLRPVGNMSKVVYG